METEHRIEEYMLTVPYLNKERRIRVLLPEDYNEKTKYPVVYFHDGQNVYFDEESYSGVSWGIIETIKENPELPKMIVVAIDNDDERRINEYTPWKFKDNLFDNDELVGGKGYEYSKFVMDVVKPYIDETYSTKSDAKHTAVIGSSLGGTITSFMGIEYQNQIERLGIFSLANWIHEEASLDYLNKNNVNKNQLVYIQVGAQEGDETQDDLKQRYIDVSLNYTKALLEKGYPLENIVLSIYADDKHTEAAWARNLPKAMRFLTQGW